MRTEGQKTPETIYLKDYAPAPFKVKHTNLDFKLLANKTIVTSTVQYAHNPESASRDLILNGQDQKLISILLNDKALTDYTLENNKLSIATPPNIFTLTITSEISPADNTALEGLYQSGGTYCTQCEAEGFRRITFYQDRPDVLSTFTVRIEADKNSCPVLLSNGNLKQQGTLKNGRHFTVWDDPFPKPCYLFALVAGDLVHIKDSFTTMSGRCVDLYIYVRAGDEKQCNHAMKSLKKAMQWDEKTYGREYQLGLFNIVAISDFNMGAMENTSLNIFNTALVLAHQETATDDDFMSVEGVIGHEYFHNWTGNRVTCRDWFQLSLKEGLTVFRDQMFSADMNSFAVQRIDDVDRLRKLQFSEDASPLAHAVQPDSFIKINNFYTTTVYEKGAELIRMQYTLLNPKIYRKATDLYFNRHDGQAVTCNDFVKCMADASGRDLSQFFLWYKQAGTPSLNVNAHYNEAQQQYTLTFKQSQANTHGQTDKKPLHIPIAVGLLNKKGSETHATQVLEMTTSEQSFTFKKVVSKPVPSLLRGFSAPVKLNANLSDEDLRLLQAHDTDGFNQWEAGQTLAMRNIERLMTDKKADISDYINSLGSLIKQGLQNDTDKALLARTLSLPDHAVIAQNQTTIDPAAIEQARSEMMVKIKQTHKNSLEKVYDANQTTGKFSISPAAMGRRALRAIMLTILTSTNGTGCASRAKKHYYAANNMTDRVAALYCLTDSTKPERDEVFNDFYERFKNYPLVIDKWFKLQAMANRKTIFDDFAKLRNHPEFNIKNPNRVRSLYTAFFIYNSSNFHHPSGKGYDLQRDVIIELNTINPQIASRQVAPFKEWKRYAPQLQEKMQLALQTILKTPTLSSDVYELVSKSLNG